MLPPVLPTMVQIIPNGWVIFVRPVTAECGLATMVLSGTVGGVRLSCTDWRG